MRKTLPLSALLLICLWSCRNPGPGTTDDSNTLPDMHTSRIALDYYGSYEGLLPCASCSGIYTVIVLIEDDTYKICRRYEVEGDERVYTSGGRFHWDDSGGKIILENEDPPNVYLVGENRLFQMDIEGRRIEGGLEKHFILEKKR